MFVKCSTDESYTATFGPLNSGRECKIEQRLYPRDTQTLSHLIWRWGMNFPGKQKGERSIDFKRINLNYAHLFLVLRRLAHHTLHKQRQGEGVYHLPYSNLWNLHFTSNSPKGFPGDSVVKSLPAMQETGVKSLGQEDALMKGMATHPSILAWRIPWTEEPGGLQSTGGVKG